MADRVPYSRTTGFAAAFLLLLAVLSLGACSEREVMPDLTGMTKDEYGEALNDAGIVKWSEIWREGDNPLKVISQTPQAGEPVTAATEVRITVSGSEPSQ